MKSNREFRQVRSNWVSLRVETITIEAFLLFKYLSARINRNNLLKN